MYVKYSLVDSKTNIPVDLEPAYNGPKTPEGVSYIYRDVNNTLYGWASKDIQQDEYLFEIEKEQLLWTIKCEYLLTLKTRKECFLNNFKVNNLIVSTKEIAEQSLVSFPRYFDFSSGVVLLNKEEYSELLSKVQEYEQKVLHWFFEFNKQINDFEEVEDIINFFDKNIYIDFIGDSDVS